MLRRDSLCVARWRLAKTGGKGIRTPDIQLAKLALYQLSYAPVEERRMSNADGRMQEAIAVAASLCEAFEEA